MNNDMQRPKQILIKNAFIITMNSNSQVFINGDILIEGDKIAAIGNVPSSIVDVEAEIIDASGKIIMPGFVNTHVHLSQHLARGLGDGEPLLNWLHNYIWPFETNLEPEDSYISSLACCLELIHSGVTTFAEPGGRFVDKMAQAVSEIGIRAILARSTTDSGLGLPDKMLEPTEKCLQEQEDLIARWHGEADGRIKVWFSLRGIFNNTDDLIVRTKHLADKHGVGIQMHVAEIIEQVRYALTQRGRTVVEHLAHLGVLGSNFLAIHCVWLTEKEIDLFLLHNVKVSHNPAAAMRFLGFARIPEMIAKGIEVSIGSDASPCNNRIDMLDEIFMAALIHKGRNLDPTILPAEKVIEMATIGGARCLLWDDLIGSLEVGKKADLIIINPKSVGSYPMHDPIANIVYSMHASNVESSMCNGKWVMRNKKILTVDEDAILEEAQERALAIAKRAGITVPKRFNNVVIR
jgi:5-methylthioadenosine/S-adenosylhomocysteine deaminase